jgi:hypothetical protein
MTPRKFYGNQDTANAPAAAEESTDASPVLLATGTAFRPPRFRPNATNRNLAQVNRGSRGIGGGEASLSPRKSDILLRRFFLPAPAAASASPMAASSPADDAIAKAL